MHRGVGWLLYGFMLRGGLVGEVVVLFWVLGFGCLLFCFKCLYFCLGRLGLGVFRFGGVVLLLW